MRTLMDSSSVNPESRAGTEDRLGLPIGTASTLAGSCGPKRAPAQKAPRISTTAARKMRARFDLLLRAAPGDYEPVELSVHPGLDKQSRFNDCCVTRAFALPFLEPAGDSLGDPRVDDGIETIEPRAIREDKRPKLGAVHTSLAVGNRNAEFAENFFVGGLARFDELVSKRIRIKYGKTQFAEHGRDSALDRKR